MKPLIYAWKNTSKSAKLLADTLGADRTSPQEGGACKEGQTVILWGAGMGAFWLERAGKVINKPEAISRAVDKIETFELLRAKKVPVPDWTESKEEAAKWCRKGLRVYARTNMIDRRGRGIDVLNAPEKFGGIPAKDYTVDNLRKYVAFTKGFDASSEFKVHVAFGKVRWVWKLAPERGEFINPLIRNAGASNFSMRFATKKEQGRLTKKAKDQLVAAVKALGLDFGVLDVGVSKTGKICVYEVNTAPAIDEYDAYLYAKMFQKELKLKDVNVVQQG